MKKQFFGLMALAAMVGGCATDKQANSHIPLRPGVLDVTPVPQSATSALPQTVQPITPVSEQPASPAAFNAGAATAGSNYTVQKGDTLYKIARERYGDGKQWQRIASANPGLSPATLKVGQKISIP